MKTITTIALSLISLIATCSAGITDKLVGTWTGTLTTTTNGQTLKARVQFSFKKYQGNGLTSRSIVTLPGNPKAVGLLQYRGNGKVSGTVTQGTFVLSQSGTWTSTSSSLTARTKISTGGVVVTEIMTFQLLKTGKLKLTETTSTAYGNAKAVATLSRK